MANHQKNYDRLEVEIGVMQGLHESILAFFNY